MTTATGHYTRVDAEIRAKHQEQMRSHERRFGKLGKPQTPKQRRLLQQANAKTVELP